MFHRFIAFFGLCLLALIPPLQALAKPDFAQKIGITVADLGADDYRFSDLRIRSKEGERHYRIRFAAPNQPPPAQGYPVIYFLDGNAVLMALNNELLSELAKDAHPPLLVMIGYDNALRIDAPGRAYDYTPQQPADQRGVHPGMPHWRNGGADDFLQLIETKIKPAVEARFMVDRQRQTLWGHSFGGIFVLHTLFTQPQAFQNFIAVEPSLWWGKRFIFNEAQNLLQQHPTLAAHLVLWMGTQRTQKKPDHAGAGANRNDTRKLAQRLAALDGLQVHYREWPEYGHGEMLDAAIAPALKEVVARPRPIDD
ncbi:alpha/beta hydrolase [Serratia sp. NPDC078593]|uniref:alpha/beta hydrolase n=1 Tax=unclassified Serratia (in: enterobacteria) TaxID=2647522 RepID=UPI0037D84588